MNIEKQVTIKMRKLFRTFSASLGALLLAASPAVAQDTSTVPPETSGEAVPAPVPVEENTLLLDLSTGGRVTIQMFPQNAPNHVERIKTLARQGFYDGVIFHRVIDGFMAQTGDPTGTGQGGSELPDLEAEFNPFPHLRGVVSMARAASEDSANSQFFIVFYPRFSLDNKYTVFGRVTGGMEYVDAINRGEPPAQPSRILQASIASDNKAPVQSIQPKPADREITVDDLNAPIDQ